MNFLCHVNCCNNHGAIAGVTYHKFPKSVAELWFSVHNIPIRKVENVSEMAVCSDHFKLEDYTDMKLKNGAIPSLYLKISKDNATEPNLACFSISKEDKSLVELRYKADVNQINNPQVSAVPDKLLNVTVLQKTTDIDVVEKVDKSLEFPDIITIADDSDMLTVINSMHNYSIAAQTLANTNEQNELVPNEVSNDLLNETHHRTDKKAPRKLSNESLKILRNRKVKSHFRNRQENTCRLNEEELIDNIILDHDYSVQDDLSAREFNGAATAYNIICSENYVWKLKKQLARYSKTTRSLRKRLDNLKSAVDVLKNRIL